MKAIHIILIIFAVVIVGVSVYFITKKANNKNIDTGGKVAGDNNDVPDTKPPDTLPKPAVIPFPEVQEMRDKSNNLQK